MDSNSTYTDSLRADTIDPARAIRQQRVELADRLRAPLAVVNGYLSLLAHDGLPARERTQAFAMAIEKCAELNQVIHQLLENPDHDGYASGSVSRRLTGPLRLRLATSLDLTSS